MSLTASMWTGVSGLKGHGSKMGVIGNNIANVSTVGFKGSRMHFEDFMSQSVNVANGVGQVGRGVAVGAILGDFSQGSLETTNEATDVAITGNGFFLVSPPGEEISYYTRAGNFRFDKDGYLIDPHGYRVQGWEVQQQGVDDLAGQVNLEQGRQVNIQGVPGDIQLENFQSPPEGTSSVSMILNLDSKSPSRAAAQNPIWDDWDPLVEPPIGPANYAYQSTIRVYDKNGGGHNLTTYFDKAPVNAGGVDPNFPGMTWDFIVTVDPNIDETGNGGLIQRGQLIFGADGSVQNMLFYDAAGNPLTNANMNFSQKGYPKIVVNFLGPGEEQETELNLGLRFQGDPNVAVAPVQADWQPQALTTTSYSSPSTTLFQSQDGYTAGFLQNISVSREGVLTGRYSNGQVLELFALTLADFNNVWGLRREGGNLFAATRDSGPALTGIAGTGRLGTVASNALELSNVDLATEFVKMISTQKGFQANSKTITTTDMMLDEVIRMKR